MGFPLLASALPILGNLFGANKARRDEEKAIAAQNAYNDRRAAALALIETMPRPKPEADPVVVEPIVDDAKN